MIVQRLVNRYPSWARMRVDPSSFGYRMFSIWGDYFDFAYAENKRVLDDGRLLKRGLGVGYIQQVQLQEDDFMESTVAVDGDLVWTYPTVSGTISATNYPCTRVDGIEELMWTHPNRLASAGDYGVTDFVVYSDDRSGTVTNNTIAYPAHLVVKVGESTNFYKKSLMRNRRASGQHLIIVDGYDVNGSPIKEYLPIRDDGYYTTRNVFSEVNELIPEGFDGAIEVTIGSPQDYVDDPFRTCVVEDDEGPLKLSISSQVVDGTPHARLYYFTDLIKRGEDYRDGSIQIENNEQEKWEQYLFSSSGTPYEPVDIAINPNSTRLYCLDTLGRVHVYDHGPTAFGPPTDQSSLTKITYMDIIPIKHWARLDEEMTMFTRFTRMRYPVQTVTIKRISPSGSTMYLQANKSWGVGAYAFPGEPNLNALVERSWNDLSFTSTFDEVGQWEFYCTVRTHKDTTVSYTGVMVDGLDALATMATGVTNPLALWFGPDDRLIVSSSNNGPDGEPNTFYTFTEHADVYMADPTNQMLYLREAYDEVTVI